MIESLSVCVTPTEDFPQLLHKIKEERVPVQDSSILAKQTMVP